MTKPVTATATMILVEECALRLDDPVDQFLPELAGRRVLHQIDGPLEDTVAARRPVTVRDLLTMTMGLGIIMALPGMYPIQAEMSRILPDQGPPRPSLFPEPDEWMRRLGTLPLAYQPGERWMYNTGFDVLGVLVARASGMPFEDFLQERIFGPLGMKDTGLFVPEKNIGRLATSYMTNPASGVPEVYDTPVGGEWSRPPLFPSGAAGLVSTADDFLAFGQMMLNKGTLGDVRILSRPSVEAMTTDQLTPGQKSGGGLESGFFDNNSWGLGVSMVTRRTGVAEVPGRFGWGGGMGTM